MTELRADCARCAGLCCVAPAFRASADFALDKPAGRACPNLRPDFRCGIHTDLRRRGFGGCAVYDCFGAGQWVTQETFGGRTWREHPGQAPRMFDVFTVVRALHELLWYVTAALALEAAAPVHADLRAAADRIGALTRAGPAALADVDVTAHRDAVNPVLVRASELARGTPGLARADRRGADLVGARLRGADLSGANLRGALLVGADLRRARLELADLTGADLRGADVRGTDLHRALFVTQSQVDAARGDAGSFLPVGLTRPAHW
jgi:uncharacterized protein YjbI with pentapeptide repeats